MKCVLVIPKAFGKFYPGRPTSGKSFEVRFKIDKSDGWKSGLPSVQNLLDHLARYTSSESSREIYLNVLKRFCEWSGYDPEKLVRLAKKAVEKLVQGYVDELAKKDRSKAYINSLIKRLRTFFRVNGYVRGKELTIRAYHVPARYRKIPEYIPTKSEVHAMADAAGSRRNRALILTLWSSGLRVSTLCALNFSDVETELANGEPYIIIRVYPEMKRRVADACKGQISYYTFLCPEAGLALRTYLIEREEKYGKIRSEDPLFYSDWTLWNREERSSKRLGRRGVGLIIKKVARLAGIPQWTYVTPHCLRKAFESVLRSPTVDSGRMDKATQEFLFGHILPGSQDPYYDRTKVDFHREEYAKLDFSRSGMSRKMIDKLIDVLELEKYLSEGWLFVAKISDDKSIVRSS